MTSTRKKKASRRQLTDDNSSGDDTPNTDLVGTENPTESQLQYGTQPLPSNSLTSTSEMGVSQLSVQDSDAKILKLKNVGFRIIGKLQDDANIHFYPFCKK